MKNVAQFSICGKTLPTNNVIAHDVWLFVPDYIFNKLGGKELLITPVTSINHVYGFK